ncbi:DUF4254 domain-containing protein [Nocardia farcinica]|uniref:DUF4254 domain-containing protein n=1 Tax=Nocardia farcinica TaxID=37329 RepID=UPI00032242B5|nr:DUF4254 domain-containing protein [Nocardia farcinica]
MPTDAADWLETRALPPRSALLRALREPPLECTQAHPVLAAARALAGCHERRRRAQVATGTVAPTAAVAEIDRDRGLLVDRINAWVAANVVHRHGASLHTETLGAVIDRMAAKWVAAQAALRANDTRTQREPLTGGAAHLEWTRLAELADGYQDLVTEVGEHRRRLPVY